MDNRTSTWLFPVNAGETPKTCKYLGMLKSMICYSSVASTRAYLCGTIRMRYKEHEYRGRYLVRDKHKSVYFRPSHYM